MKTSFDDFNVHMYTFILTGSCDTIGLKHFIKDMMCYKAPQIPSTVDPKLSLNSLNIKNYCVIKIALSDFHRMVVTALKISFKRLSPRVIYIKETISLLKTKSFLRNFYINHQI